MDDDPGWRSSGPRSSGSRCTASRRTWPRRWEHFATLRSGDDRANWIYVDPSRDFYELNSAPLDVGEALARSSGTKRTCVLTSATLAVDGKFDFLKHELGLPARHAGRGPRLPVRLPEPGAADPAPAARCRATPGVHAGRLPRDRARSCWLTQGRAFVLFTSYRSLREIVGGGSMGRLPFPCKTQEDLPRARLMEWFKNTPNAVLFATATFWEGVDIPGEALYCVIIDKLPFASPDDPVVQARTERMKARDEDWFNDYMPAESDPGAQAGLRAPDPHPHRHRHRGAPGPAGRDPRLRPDDRALAASGAAHRSRRDDGRRSAAGSRSASTTGEGPQPAADNDGKPIPPSPVGKPGYLRGVPTEGGSRSRG